MCGETVRHPRDPSGRSKSCNLHRTSAKSPLKLELAMKTKKILGGGGAESVTFRDVRLELPPPRCITDRSRSRRSLYIRLETWLARLVWEAVAAGRGIEAELIGAELHYIRDHLRKKRRGPCELCRCDMLERFERFAHEDALQVFREVQLWASTSTKKQ